MTPIFLAAAAILAHGAVMPPACARTSDPGTDGARQVVGLFAHTCLMFAGRTDAMRDMLARRGMPSLPSAARELLMPGMAGAAFDATTGTMRLALFSADDGSCTALAERADGTEVLRDLATDLAVIAPHARPMPGDAGHATPPPWHDHYALTLQGRPYGLAVTTSDVQGRAVQATLTLASGPFAGRSAPGTGKRPE